MKLIEEIRQITADNVKQEEEQAKVRFPKLIDTIRKQAQLGASDVEFKLYEINQYDKKLLEAEGFSVRLLSREMSKAKWAGGIESYIGDYLNDNKREQYWVVSW